MKSLLNAGVRMFLPTCVADCSRPATVKWPPWPPYIATKPCSCKSECQIGAL